MQKVKIRPADFPMSAVRTKIDLPVVLSLAGIVSVAAVVGAAAFHSGAFDNGTRYIASIFTSTEIAATKTRAELTEEITRLDQKLAEVSAKLDRITQAQSTAATRADKIEDAFTSITASIPTPTALNSSPYQRLLETGWDADDMVTRKQKRDRIALLNSEAMTANKTRIKTTKAQPKTKYAVELASYKNIITARNAWQRLAEFHGHLLSKLEPHLLPALDAKDENGRVKLIIGPIASAAQAAQVCSALRSNGQKCQERLFSSTNVMVVSAPKDHITNSTK